MTDFGASLELAHPAFLAGLAVVPLLIYYYARGLTDLARWQRLLSLACRTILLVLLVLAAAGLTRLEPTSDLFVVFVLDESLSVGPESRRAVDAYIDRALAARGDHRVAFLSFAAEPGLVRAERGGDVQPVDAQGTDIAAALDVAAAAIPPSYVPHIVLLSDGNATQGDALRSALRAGAPISTVPLRPRDDPEVQVSAVRVPAQVREGEPFNVDVVIDSNHDDEGAIEIYRGPHKLNLAKERYQVKKGENRFQFRQVLEGERLATFTVKIRGFQDTLRDNNSGFGLVYTAGKPRVLLIESELKLAQPLRDALEEEGIQVEVRPPRGMPDTLADLQNYELLILSNVPATDLKQRQMEVARTFVQHLGGGLIMIGGDQSFGLGGYYKTTLEDILPVRSDFEKEKEKPSLAMVLIIDRSGSMSGTKIEQAKEAAKNAVDLLGSQDKVGVIAFDAEFQWVTDHMQPGSNKGQVIDRISRIEANGGTVIYPALKEAFETLQTTTAKIKHVILLTDGMGEQADFEGLAATMAAAPITVSTVALGEDADRRLLTEIARVGNGRFYPVDDPTSVPQIFAKETITASKSALNEEAFAPQIVRPTPVLAGIDLAPAPLLLGHVRTRPKATSEVILSTERHDPLLAWWRYGLGMSVAFTADAKSRWAAEWLTWPGFSKFWAQIVRHAMRKNEARGVMVQVEQKGRQATVTLDAVDPTGKFVNQAEGELTVISDQELGHRSVPMRQAAPGRYVAEFDTPHAGSYHLELTQKLHGQVLYHQSRGLAVGYPDELRLRPTNETMLQAIAHVSTGRYNPAPVDVFAPLDRTARRPVPLWPYLLMAAALVFVLDVALRRIDLAVALGRWRERWRRRPPVAGSAPRAQAPVTPGVRHSV
jgi:Mg-chelatase subunit ChlD